jgi:hypothetical protein
VTDQLNLGLRNLEIDVHWFLGEARICHATNLYIEAINDLVKWIENQLGIRIEWNSQKLGCFGLDLRTFTDQLKEIELWFNKPENKDEILVLYLGTYNQLIKR